MKKLIVGVAAALSLFPSNAAADGVDRAPPPTIAAPYAPLVPTWSGLYIGAGVGAGAVVHDVTVEDIDDGEILGFDGVGGEGILGTVIAGWDWQIGSNVVAGVFVDYDFSDISTDVSSDFFDVSAGIDHDNSWSVGGRLGVLSSPSTLWYATAGYTEAEFEAFADLDSVEVFSADQTFSGYFVGAGIDTRLAASNWFLRLEYRFTEFDGEREILTEFTDLEVEPSMHTARLTLTYKLGGGLGWNWGQ